MRPYRKERVASVVHTIVSEAIAHRMNDPRVEPLTTITRVEVTPDLLVAKVYLSVPGGQGPERKTLSALQHAAGYVQAIVARELNIRQCPELRFLIDEAWKGARHTLELLEENRRKEPHLFPPEEDESPLPEEEDLEEDDEE
jgi:ribosome-binding factor A